MGGVSILWGDFTTPQKPCLNLLATNPKFIVLAVISALYFHSKFINLLSLEGCVTMMSNPRDDLPQRKENKLKKNHKTGYFVL